MFTGIVEELGMVKGIAHGKKSIQITIAAEKVLEGLAIGDSIAVNGACLTVVRFGAREFTADVMPETMRLTVLAQLKNGSAVNLERALTLSSRLGGHIVSGHVDGVGEIMDLQKDDNAIVLRISAETALTKYIMKKGSVTIDGISLTVVEADRESFSISMIPHTAAVTMLGMKKIGDFVNIETDLLGRYVERLLGFQEAESGAPSKITRDFLSRYGY